MEKKKSKIKNWMMEWASWTVTCERMTQEDVKI